MKDLMILKLGGSIITDKSSPVPKLADSKFLERVSKEIHEAWKNDKFSLIIITGAGSYGHPIVKRTGINYGIKEKKQLVDFAEVQRLQTELSSLITKYFVDAGLPAIPIQASAISIMNSVKLKNMHTDVIEKLLNMGMLPYLSGVPAYDEKQGCSILSGDEIAPYLAKKFNAKKIIHATDVDGIFTADPKVDKSAKLIPEITKENLAEVQKALSGSLHTDISGGMARKVGELLHIGTESQIINGLKEGNIYRALNGEKIGTMIKP